jgi:tRNA pseudouridine38-40 synthase
MPARRSGHGNASSASLAAENIAFALVLEYDGAAYAGYQLQPGLTTVQGVLERALHAIYALPIRTRAASRTDTGVHAEEQVVAFSAPPKLVPERLRLALNHHLPEDVQVRGVWEVPASFEPRRHALSRVYTYDLWNAPYRSPLHRARAHFIPKPLDVALMAEAASALEGSHDFRAFTTPEYAAARSTTRRVLEARVERDGRLVRLTMEATAFLPHQVRRTAGALVQVGLGKLPVGALIAMVEQPGETFAGPALPPHGLTLAKVYYADFPLRNGGFSALASQPNPSAEGRTAPQAALVH